MIGKTKLLTEYHIKVFQTQEEMRQGIFDIILQEELYNVIHIGDPLEADVNKIKRISGCDSKKEYTKKILKMTGGSLFCIIYKTIKTRKYIKKLKMNQLK